MKNISEKFKCAILARYPNAQNLRTPDTPGSQNNVIFADVNNKTYVFKFGNINQIKKNIEVSKLYKLRKIPCPEIKLGEYDGLFFEEYEMLPGITLHEAVKNGLPADKIKQIYCEIIDNIVKMGRIPGAHLVNTKNIYVHQCAKEHITNVNGSVLGYICMAAVYTMNIGDKKHRKIFFNSSIIFFMNYEKKLGGWREKSRYQITLMPAKSLISSHKVSGKFLMPWVNRG